MQYKIAVSTAFGVESCTKKELKNLGVVDPKAVDGSFVFYGDSLLVARLNMFLRTAERVLIRLGEFQSSTFDELYEGVVNMPWEDFVTTDGRFLVNGKTKKSNLFALSSIQSIIKKAIIERLKKHTRVKTFDEEGSDYRIEFALDNNICTMSLDTSGAGLHKRGYRDRVGTAPIKETLACAMLMLSDFSGDRPFVDPFCGSGTLPIEGARMALNIASGMDRSFDYCAWDNFDKNVYNLALEEAQNNIIRDKTLRFSGFDIDKNAIRLCNYHAERAGVKNHIHFQVQPVTSLSSRFSQGVIVTNPPYGERLLTFSEANALYKSMGETFAKLDNWSIFVITSAPQFEKYYGRRAEKNRKFFNSQKECHYYSYFMRKPTNNFV